MSTEASRDGQRDAADQAEQVTAASAGVSAAEVSVADGAADPGPAAEPDQAPGASEASGPSGTSGTGEDGPDGDAGADQVSEVSGADGEHDEHASGARRDDDDYEDYYDDGYDDRAVNAGETGDGQADPPTELIDFAEPVELDGAAPLRPRRRRWSRLLIAVGFVIVAAAIIGGAAAIVGSVTHGFKKPVKVTYKKSAVFSLKTGDCFDPAGQSYTLISCNSPHTAEVFGTFALTGTTWPGSSAVSADASRGCATRLTDYLNPQLSISLASTYVYPDATAWQAGTRTVICEVRAASGDLTGSVRGASVTAG